ncbi:hypothetical protein GCM10011575_18070 [Microlunatus endophyticus]|uniref:Arylsulfotransferase (ASST) n=2 Tax=Microlunatus endophyticus TaxID=1716077 RepID=A0A917S5B9_9ACTN|nr:hypothetical protein GCM10011575_18070 [Microlunatus endophyticus]
MTTDNQSDDQTDRQTDQQDQPDGPRATRQRLGRREVLGLSGVVAGAAALGAAGLVGYRIGRSDGTATSRVSASASPDGSSGTANPGTASTATSFRTRPDLSPPEVIMTRAGAGPKIGSQKYIFLAPKQYTATGTTSSQSGPMIIDHAGRLVWFSPTDSAEGQSDVVMDFRPQTYRGRPVLTWWEGTSANGYGTGTGVIADSSYTKIATVNAVGNLQADLHEFLITARNTAYLTAYRRTTTDLTAAGGLSKGNVLSGVVQEIDIATGKLLFSWDSLDHVDPTASYVKPTTNPGDTLDYFHINSIFELDNDTLLISSRNTWAVYAVAKSSGRVLWRLGGQHSDFHHATGTRFEWQHHATQLRPGRLMIFDNASAPAQERQSRALLLDVDTKSMTVALVRALTHPAGLLADSQGSFQHLSTGEWFVGWGAEPYFSQFSTDGTLVLDGKLPDNVQSYRTLSGTWTGQPGGKPVITAGTNAARGSTVYASWNGATEVAQWTVLAGSKQSALRQLAKVPRAGFETGVAVDSTGPYFQVIGVDVHGAELGRSDVLKASF